jgi:hypothetical protein
MIEPESYEEYKHEHEELVRPFLEAIYKGNLMLWGALTFHQNHVTSPFLAQDLSEREREIEEAEANNNYDYADELKRIYQKTIDLYSIPKRY